MSPGKERWERPPETQYQFNLWQHKKCYVFWAIIEGPCCPTPPCSFPGNERNEMLPYIYINTYIYIERDRASKRARMEKM